MTRREMLVEQYEDALFALLMDEVAEAEGQKALEENQRLRESGEMVIPDNLRQRCHSAIARKSAEIGLKQFGRGLTKIVTKVAVVALVGMLLFTTAFAASEDFRLKALNIVMEVFDDHIEIKVIKNRLEITVGVIVKNDSNVKTVCENLQKKIFDNILDMTNIKAKTITVDVLGFSY